MITLKEWLCGSSNVEKMFEVQYMSEDMIKKQSKLLFWNGVVYIALLSLLLFVTLKATNNPVINVLFFALISCVWVWSILWFVIEICLATPNKKLNEINDEIKFEGKYYSACGCAKKIMDDIKIYDNRSYKDGVDNQAREFTLLDLWALKNLHKTLRKDYECKVLYAQ